MSLKQKTNDDSIQSHFYTSTQLKEQSISVPAQKLREIANDTTGKYKAEYIHTPPGMRWCRDDNGKRVLEEMPKRKKRSKYIQPNDSDSESE